MARIIAFAIVFFALASLANAQIQTPIEYTVQPGDNLWKISQHLTGNPKNYVRPWIVVKDPHGRERSKHPIFPGDKVSVPLEKLVTLLYQIKARETVAEVCENFVAAEKLLRASGHPAKRGDTDHCISAVKNLNRIVDEKLPLENKGIFIPDNLTARVHMERVAPQMSLAVASAFTLGVISFVANPVVITLSAVLGLIAGIGITFVRYGRLEVIKPKPEPAIISEENLNDPSLPPEVEDVNQKPKEPIAELITPLPEPEPDVTPRTRIRAVDNFKRQP